MKTMISNDDVPTDAARLPYTINMEKRKEKRVTSKPSVKTFRRAKPVVTATTNRHRLPIPMALRLCCTGPGLSITQIQSAPNDNAIPRSNKLNCNKIRAGAKIPKDMRNPSEKYWLKKKLFISLVCIITL